ncbi:hypothetical protein SRABI128_06485 [Microbacterium sp. Bi128]|nr:hypothetical protein SRABI128_06485 [Microbacterium sp. Bi128]
MGGADCAQLRDGDGGFGQQFKGEGLEFGVGAVDLVQEQHGRPRAGMFQRLQERAPQQVLGGKQVRFRDLGVADFGQPDAEQLALVVPLIEGLTGVDSLVALQPVQRGVEELGQRLSGLRLPDPRLALEQDGLRQADSQEQGRRQSDVGQVVGPVQRGHQRSDIRDPAPHVLLRAGPRRRRHRAPSSPARRRR